MSKSYNPLATQRHSSQLMAERVPQSNHPGSPGGYEHWALDLNSRAGSDCCGKGKTPTKSYAVAWDWLVGGFGILGLQS